MKKSFVGDRIMSRVGAAKGVKAWIEALLLLILDFFAEC